MNNEPERRKLIYCLAEKLCKKLNQAGFIVHRYNAETSNSVYLKIDYGVNNCIRISDHIGKAHMKYRYNIGPYIKNKHTKPDGRNYYMPNQVRILVNDIISDRDKKVYQLGMEAYYELMCEEKAHKGRSGFWDRAELVGEKSYE